MDYQYDVYWCDVNKDTNAKGLVTCRYTNFKKAINTAEENDGIIVPVLCFDSFEDYYDNETAVDRVRHRHPNNPGDLEYMKSQTSLDAVGIDT